MTRHALLVLSLMSCAPELDPAALDAVDTGRSPRLDATADATPDGAPVETSAPLVDAGLCLGDCRSDDDCDAGWRCRHWIGGSYTCVDPTNSERPPRLSDLPSVLGLCETSADCEDGEACTLGRARLTCVRECASRDDCGGLPCIQGVCERCDPRDAARDCGALSCGLRELAQIGTCLPLCGTDDDCAAAGRVCTGP